MIGERLKSLRKMYGMTLEDVGKRIGVTKATAQRYEAEKISVPYDKICMLADLFQVQPGYLFSNNTTKNMNKGNNDEIEEALKLYKQYKNAIPQIQSAVDSLLKSDESQP